MLCRAYYLRIARGTVGSEPGNVIGVLPSYSNRSQLPCSSHVNFSQKSNALNNPTANAVAARPNADHSKLWPDASLIGVSLIWGINIPLMKTGLEQMDVFVFNAIRLLISAAVLAFFAILERSRTPPVKSGIRFYQAFIFGMVMSAAYQVAFLIGIANTTSGNTALIISTIPMWTALLARVFLGEALRRIAWVGLTIALMGTIVVALQKGDVTTGKEYLIGNLVVLAAALLWSGGTVYSRQLLKQISPMQLAAVAAAVALPVHLSLGVGSYRSSFPALESTELVWIIIYSGVLSSGLALPMWNYGVRHAGPAHAAINQNLVPLIAIFSAWIARGEVATTAQLLGGALILGGLVTMRAGRISP